MNRERRKFLLEGYKNRRPEMGVVSFFCNETGESFLGAATDTKVSFTSTCVKLRGGSHPNRTLQALWNQYGESGFTLSVLEVLDYEDPQADHREDLEALRALCLEADPKAQKIWL